MALETLLGSCHHKNGDPRGRLEMDGHEVKPSQCSELPQKPKPSSTQSFTLFLSAVPYFDQLSNGPNHSCK
ncbi:hypothetical protein J4Q44_G00214920 [Coregonus suidteri]|uniref:Uncharacterized protein n=1 Tax=Coregonus suidteri TaxID=861788 RepID=A0AAN8LU20_9TELE